MISQQNRNGEEWNGQVVLNSKSNVITLMECDSRVHLLVRLPSATCQSFGEDDSAFVDGLNPV